MSRVTRGEVHALVTKAQEQVKQAKALQQQLDEWADRIDRDVREAFKAATKRKTPKK